MSSAVDSNFATLQQCEDILRLQEEACNILKNKVSSMLIKSGQSTRVCVLLLVLVVFFYSWLSVHVSYTARGC